MYIDCVMRSWVPKTNDRHGARHWDSRAEQFGKKPIPTAENSTFLGLVERTYEGDYGNFLDIGCGAGQYSVAASKKFKRVTGIDISENMIRCAEDLAHLNGADIEFIVGDWENLPETAPVLGEKYDLVIANMTPAVDSAKSFVRMIKVCCGAGYLVKPTRRKDAIGREINRIVGQHKEAADESIPYAFSILWHFGFEPHAEYWKEEWDYENTVEACKDYYLSALDRDSISPEKEAAVDEYLASVSSNGRVHTVTNLTISAVYWSAAD